MAPSNISPGGQVYDRTTGTWAGDNQGTVGGGYTGDGVGRSSLVIFDANGPVGVQFASRSLPDGPGAGLTSNGVKQAGAASVAASVSGPAAPAVAATPGAAKKGGWPGKFPALTAKVKDENTSLVIGGVYIEAPPGFSNVDQWEELLGEPGEFLGAPFVLGGLIGHNARRAWDQFGPAYQQYVESQPPPSYAGKGAWVLEGAADWWAQANSPHGPDKPIWGFDSGGF